MRLLQQAETLLRSGIHSHRHSWDHLHDQDHLRSWDHLCPDDCTDQHTVWAIFSFLVWDCMAEVLEEPEAKRSGGILGMIEQLSASGRVEAALLQEVEQCWTEGDAESLLQSVRVLAQVLRDLHPLQEGLQLSSSVEGLFSCRPSRLHRVTSFQGVSPRVIRKALSSMVPSSSDQDTTLLARQHMEVCVRFARLLDVVQPKRTTVDFSNAPIATVIQHVRFVLSNPAFNSEPLTREFAIACFQCWSSILRSWDWALSCSSTRRPYPNSKHTCNSASTTTSSLFSNRYGYSVLPSCFPSAGFTGLSPSTMGWRRSFVLSRQNPLRSWYDCTVFVMKKEGGASRCVRHVAHVCICSKQKGCVTCSGAVATFWLR